MILDAPAAGLPRCRASAGSASRPLVGTLVAGRRWPSARCGLTQECARARIRRRLGLHRRDRGRERGLRRRLRRRRRSCCGSPNCRLSSGSWSTCSAARAGRDGARSEASAWDAFVAASDPGSYLQTLRLGRGQGRQRLDGPPDHDRRGRRADRRPDPRPASPARCRGGSPTRRAARWRPRGRRTRSRRSPSLSGSASAPTRVASATCGSTPRSRPTARSTPTARSGAALRGAGWRPGAADPAGLDAGHRPARRRGRAVGRPAQEVAPVRQQGADAAASSSWTPRATACGEFYRIYRETADRAGLPDPDRGRLPRRLGRLPRRPATPGCCSPQTADGEPVATLFLVRCGPRVVEPYGGMTAAGAESRANYLLKWEAIRTRRARPVPRATTCGASRPAGSPTSRPGSAVARSATSARGTSCSTRSGGRPTRPRSARPRPLGAPPPRGRRGDGGGRRLTGRAD